MQCVGSWMGCVAEVAEPHTSPCHQPVGPVLCCVGLWALSRPSAHIHVCCRTCGTSTRQHEQHHLIPIRLEIESGLKQNSLRSLIRCPNSPPNVMDPSRSLNKCHLLHINYNFPRPGPYMTSSTHPSCHKQGRMEPGNWVERSD